MTVVPSHVELVSVNVGKPGFLGERQGRMVESGIRKLPVAERIIVVSATNLAGDGQADLVNHGGFEKAVYAYPFEHLARWTDELNPDAPFGPGAFGENLSIGGWLEHQACIGDVWRWGSAVLQVCQPRFPCYKLGMATGFPDVVDLLVANGRTGWYLRVLESGEAPAAGPIVVAERDAHRVTVLEAHRARLPGASMELIGRVAESPALASGLRKALLARMDKMAEAATVGRTMAPRV